MMTVMVVEQPRRDIESGERVRVRRLPSGEPLTVEGSVVAHGYDPVRGRWVIVETDAGESVEIVERTDDRLVIEPLVAIEP